MKKKNLRFFSENGRRYNFTWDSEQELWKGNVWFSTTSEGLYNSKAIYITEEFYDVDKNEKSFRYPISDQDLTIRALWESEEERNIFLFQTQFLETPVDRFLDPVVAATSGPISVNDGVLEMDGYQLNEDDRVLVKDQADLKENGIYVVMFDNTLQRVTELSDGKTLRNNVVRVTNGVENKNTLWRTAAIYNESIIGEDEIGWIEIDESEIDSNQFINDFLSVDRQSYINFGVINDPVVYGTEGNDGLMEGSINQPFEGPIQIFSGFYGNKDSETERTLLLKIPETNEIIAEIEFYGASEQEDISLTNFLDNIGKQIQNQDIKYFKEFDIEEAEPDFKELNAKRKELVLNWHQIYPYLGSYQALVYALRFFGYNDIKIKEFYRNVDKESLNYQKLLHSKIIDTFNRDSEEYQNLLYSAPQQLDNEVYRKTNLLGLFYDLNDRETYDFKTDVSDNIVLPYSHAEMVIKLFGLREKLENEFLPLGSRLVDITGEGWYYQLKDVYSSTTDLVIDEFNKYYDLNFNVNTYSRNKIGELKESGEVSSIPTVIKFESLISDVDNNELQNLQTFVKNSEGTIISNEWESDFENIKDLEITELGEWKVYIRIQDWFGNTFIYDCETDITTRLYNLVPNIINDETRKTPVFQRNTDFQDLLFDIDIGQLFVKYQDDFEIVDIDHQNNSIYVNDSVNVDLNNIIRFSLISNEQVYQTMDLMISNILVTSIEIDGNLVDVKEIKIETWDSIINDSDIDKLRLHILPDPSFLNANWNIEQYSVSTFTNDSFIGSTNVFERDRIQYETNFEINFSDNYYLTLDLSNVIKNQSSIYRLNLSFKDYFNNEFVINDLDIIKLNRR